MLTIGRKLNSLEILTPLRWQVFEWYAASTPKQLPQKWLWQNELEISKSSPVQKSIRNAKLEGHLHELSVFFACRCLVADGQEEQVGMITGLHLLGYLFKHFHCNLKSSAANCFRVLLFVDISTSAQHRICRHDVWFETFSLHFGVQSLCFIAFVWVVTSWQCVDEGTVGDLMIDSEIKRR